jgi:hypothetical protein
MDSRKLGLAAATFLGGAAALTAAAIAFGRRQNDASVGGMPQPLDAADGPAPSYEQAREQAPSGGEGHAAPDLGADAPVTLHSRAPEAFRPDMDAPMTPAEREALRPAIGPSPTLVDAGTSMPA